MTGQSLPCGEQLVHDLQLADVSVRVAPEDKVDHDLWEVKQKSARAGYQTRATLTSASRQGLVQTVAVFHAQTDNVWMVSKLIHRLGDDTQRWCFFSDNTQMREASRSS